MNESFLLDLLVEVLGRRTSRTETRSELESVRRSRGKRSDRRHAALEERVNTIEEELRSMALLFGAFLMRAEERGLMTRAEIGDVLTGLPGRAEADTSARSLLGLGRSLGFLHAPEQEDLERARGIPTSRGADGELQVLMPELGGETHGEVFEWQVAPGDRVRVAQPIAQVLLNRATVEIPSPSTGTVTALHASRGASVEVGAPLVSLAESTNDA